MARRSETFYKLTVPAATPSFAISVPMSVVTSEDTAGDWYIDLSTTYGYSAASLSTAPPVSTLSVTASPASMSFTGQSGGEAPAPQTASVMVTNSQASWFASTTTSTGEEWLQVSQRSGYGDSKVSVLVDASWLQPGRLCRCHEVHPLHQHRHHSEPGADSLNWTASTSTQGGGYWLSVMPASGTVTGTSAGSSQVTAAGASLAPGSYSGTVTVSAPGAERQTFVIPVSFTASPP